MFIFSTDMANVDESPRQCVAPPTPLQGETPCQARLQVLFYLPALVSRALAVISLIAVFAALPSVANGSFHRYCCCGNSLAGHVLPSLQRPPGGGVQQQSRNMGLPSRGI